MDHWERDYMLPVSNNRRINKHRPPLDGLENNRYKNWTMKEPVFRIKELMTKKYGAYRMEHSNSVAYYMVAQWVNFETKDYKWTANYVYQLAHVRYESESNRLTDAEKTALLKLFGLKDEDDLY